MHTENSEINPYGRLGLFHVFIKYRFDYPFRKSILIEISSVIINRDWTDGGFKHRLCLFTRIVPFIVMCGANVSKFSQENDRHEIQ